MENGSFIERWQNDLNNEYNSLNQDLLKVNTHFDSKPDFTGMISPTLDAVKYFKTQSTNRKNFELGNRFVGATKQAAHQVAPQQDLYTITQQKNAATTQPLQLNYSTDAGMSMAAQLEGMGQKLKAGQQYDTKIVEGINANNTAATTAANKNALADVEAANAGNAGNASLINARIANEMAFNKADNQVTENAITGIQNRVDTAMAGHNSMVMQNHQQAVTNATNDQHAMMQNLYNQRAQVLLDKKNSGEITDAEYKQAYATLNKTYGDLLRRLQQNSSALLNQPFNRGNAIQTAIGIQHLPTSTYSNPFIIKGKSGGSLTLAERKQL